MGRNAAGDAPGDAAGDAAKDGRCEARTRIEQLELQALEAANASAEGDGKRAGRVVSMEVGAEGMVPVEEVGREGARRAL